MGKKFLVPIAGGAALIAATVWFTLPGPPRSAGDPSRARYLYCPNCEREKPYSPLEKDQQCLYCDRPMIGSEVSVKQARGSNPYGLTLMLVFTEVVGLMFVAWLLAQRSADPAEEYIYISCEFCGQKIRYREHQVGNTALCPRCRKPFVFPECEDD